ncbi:MAG: hypothetical protein ACR2JC_21005 [Chloroflexota bacterium]|nr:MAG: hypothetical protein DLM70_18005 [Chloroflexota bacterium]
MAEELGPLDISHMDDVRRLVEEVQAAEKTRMLQVDQKDAALLVPAHTKNTKAYRGRPTSASDPLWKIVGSAHTEGPGDVAENIDDHMANAYAPNGE